MRHMFMKAFLAFALILVLAQPVSAATRDEQRLEIQKMKSTVLGSLYKAQPQAERQLKEAAGYAVFSSADLAALFFSGSYGHGIAHNNANSDETYMKMASVGVGLGVGVKDFRAVFIFDNKKAYNDFVTTGLDLSGHVDMAAKQGSSGGAVTGAADVIPGVKVYQLTETGLLAQAMLKGTKYWRDADLNQYDQSSDASREFSFNQ